ncbi:unnamed protein product [Brachionus calyciflorus]|uniref:Uncharacterized protein n=1 Tax=Brachionus calyciflorus TaxID=104777 RepID=A0A814QGL6_9BILA|nr:unnamed protein product [Brachionus calyciflorus]
MFILFLNIFLFLMIDSSIYNEYCLIQKDVYYSSALSTLIINDPQVISNIQLTKKCLENVTTLNKIDLRNNRDFTLDLKQFDFDKISTLNFKIQKKINLKLNFISFKSYIVDSIEPKRFSRQVILGVGYEFSNFLFYFEGKLVQTCSQIRHIKPYSLLNYVSYLFFQIEFAFRNVNICPLVFTNVSIQRALPGLHEMLCPQIKNEPNMIRII